MVRTFNIGNNDQRNSNVMLYGANAISLNHNKQICNWEWREDAPGCMLLTMKPL